MNKRLFTLMIFVITLSLIVTGCGKGIPGLSKTQNKFIGSWQDLKDPTRFAKVSASTKNNITWEDNEDKYPAHFDENTLRVPVAKATSDAVIVYISETDHLKATFEGKTFEFKRK
jgi:hypothetical protein